MTADDFYEAVESIRQKYEVEESVDFQCDQTGEFPSKLCVCWELEKAWLELSDHQTPDVEPASYQRMCADFGIRRCEDVEDFNGLLEQLGEDAYQTAYLPEDDMTFQ